jgi:DNA helicase-2/ATP-dependent DNA helicase PcrA
VVSLTTNYRCSPQVVSAGAAALSAAGQVDDTASNRPDGVGVRIAVYPTAEAEAAGIVGSIRNALHVHQPVGISVLARTNEQLVVIDQALSDAGIATERAVGRTPLEMTLAEAFRTTSREALALWADEQFIQTDAVRRRVAEEVDRYLASHEGGGFRSWVESRTPFDELDTESVGGAVALLTFHGAKGREWPFVILAGAEDGLIPHSSAVTPAQLAEEARLFYVAITRAVDQLVITRAESRRGLATGPSPWLDAVEATIADDTPIPPPVWPLLAMRSADPLAELKAWRSQIARRAGTFEQAICSDSVLRGLLERPPSSTDELAARLGVTPLAAEGLRLPRSGPDHQSSSTMTGA